MRHVTVIRNYPVAWLFEYNPSTVVDFIRFLRSGVILVWKPVAVVLSPDDKEALPERYSESLMEPTDSPRRDAFSAAVGDGVSIPSANGRGKERNTMKLDKSKHATFRPVICDRYGVNRLRVPCRGNSSFAKVNLLDFQHAVDLCLK